MGRHKMEQVQELNTADGDEPIESVKLKSCPKCGEGEAKVFKDSQGNYRCSCGVCNFWDSIVSLTPADAARKWNEAGGPAVEW